MARYSKGDIEFHAEHYRPSRPAVNVKAYHFPDIYDVMDAFDCSEETAQAALNYAFESAQEIFWYETAQELANYHLSPRFGSVTVYSEGRSSGWLVVDGLGYREDVEDSWDALDLTAWYAFEKAVKAEVEWLTSWEQVRDSAEANRWAEEGANQYNFYEFSDGHSECFVDMKAEGKACPHCSTILA